MTPAEVLIGVRASLHAIQAPRLFETERGYQGALLGQLERHLNLPARVIVEQEYQKKAGSHALKIRPDIIIHEPFDAKRNADRTEGNLAVVEIKLHAAEADAVEDFNSLCLMLDVLRYPLGIFINIGDTRTWFEVAPKAMRERLVCFAVALQGEAVVVIEEGAGTW